MTLNQARDIAAIILIAETFILGLMVLALFLMGVRGLGQLLPKVRYWLRLAYSWVLQAEMMVAMLMRWLLAPILLISGLRAGLREGVAALRRR
jgi:hypothetical protein